nr:LEAF RUST 10 DISEASE-RESISTANCE LOCUS RECEPTOR-LIKE PROTEIN KINASE-like 2.1 isoform X2 [Coffea arabica]
MHQNASGMYSSVEFFNLCIFFFILLVEKSSAAHYQYEACVPQACGKISIKFPFYIGGLQESYCGHPGFELSCSNSPAIHLTEDDYVIDTIQYENRTFRVHNEAVSTVRGCLPQIGNISEDSLLGIVDTSRLHLLSNCNSKLPEVLSSYKVNYCDPSNKEDLGLVMLGEDRNLNIALQECNTNVLAPVEVDKNGGNGIVDYEGLLRKGFLLNWTVADCSRCERSGGRCGFNETDGRMRCFCPDRPHLESCKPRKKNLKVILPIAASAGGLGILVILAYFFQRKYSFLRIWSKREKFQNVEDFLKDYGSLAPKRYRYSVVKKMTDSFKIKLGQGGYGCVYKGKLQDGSPVAVKVLKELKGSGEEFVNEVASISRTSHINVVTLLGFCFQGRKRALVYEFMPNGSLEKFIYGGKSLTDCQLGWQILYKIAVGIARGLEYLHRGCNTRILHFDIKPHNILLDENFCPKISDFGLAKLCLQNESIVSILGARGTVGYIAPEVFCKNIGGVSHKSDVYSYGMMVFEMVGGRKNIDVGVDHSSEIYFPHWIYARLDRGEEDLGLHGISNEEENELARKMIIVSLWCIQTDPVNRPSMTKVVEMLEGNLEALEAPPKPFLSSPARASDDSSTIYTFGTVS